MTPLSAKSLAHLHDPLLDRVGETRHPALQFRHISQRDEVDELRLDVVVQRASLVQPRSFVRLRHARPILLTGLLAGRVEGAATLRPRDSLSAFVPHPASFSFWRTRVDRSSGSVHSIRNGVHAKSGMVYGDSKVSRIDFGYMSCRRGRSTTKGMLDRHASVAWAYLIP